MKTILILFSAYFFLNPFYSGAQSSDENVLIFKSDSLGEYYYYQQNDRIKLSSDGTRYSGKVKSITSDSILIFFDWVRLDAIDSIKRPRKNKKVQFREFVGYPIQGIGFAAGVMGIAPFSSLNDDTADFEDETYLLGAGLLIVGAGLVYLGDLIVHGKSFQFLSNKFIPTRTWIPEVIPTSEVDSILYKKLNGL